VQKGSDIVLHYIKEGSLKYTKKLPDLEKIYNDPYFGYVSWCPSKMIIFVGQLKQKEEETFNDEAYGEAFRYKKDFGETIRGKSRPTLLLFDLSTYSLQDLTLQEGLIPMTPLFIND